MEGQEVYRPLTRWGSIVLLAGGIMGLVLVENVHALRPFRAATDAAVVDPGKVEVELGFDVSRNTPGDNDETSYALPSVAFNIGVVDRFEVEIGTGFELVDDDTENRTLGSVSDTELTFKTLWWKGEESAPSIATEVSVTIPTAREEFQPGEKRRVGVTGLVALTGEAGPL